MNWKRLVKRIPHLVQVTSKVSYEILYTPKIVDVVECLGTTRIDYKQIRLKNDQTPKSLVHTYIHEVVHAFSEEYDIDLTEKQVRAIEKALYYILKEGNILT